MHLNFNTQSAQRLHVFFFTANYITLQIKISYYGTKFRFSNLNSNNKKKNLKLISSRWRFFLIWKRAQRITSWLTLGLNALWNTLRKAARYSSSLHVIYPTNEVLRV